MLNLVRMDFYRLFRSKVLKIGIIASALISLLAMLLNLGILELIKLGLGTDPTTAEGIGFILPIVSCLIRRSTS